MTVYYPDDLDGPMHSLWWYMFVKQWRVWAVIAAIWVVVCVGWLIDPPGWYWFLSSVVSWSFVAWSCMRIRWDWRDHKEDMRRIEYRHQARMIQIDRRHQKLMQHIEQVRNARWN